MIKLGWVTAFNKAITTISLQPTQLITIRNFCLYHIIGLSAENHLPMSTAVELLRGAVQFAGMAEEEWKELIEL